MCFLEPLLVNDLRSPIFNTLGSHIHGSEKLWILGPSNSFWVIFYLSQCLLPRLLEKQQRSHSQQKSQDSRNSLRAQKSARQNISQRSDHCVINEEIEILDHRIFYFLTTKNEDIFRISLEDPQLFNFSSSLFSMPQNLTPRHCGRYPTDATDETSSASTQISPLDTSTQLGPRWRRQREVPKPGSEDGKVSLEELTPLNIQ